MGFEVLIPVFAIAATAAIILTAMRQSHERTLAETNRTAGGGAQDNAALRLAVSRLEERLAVIERITVDKENSLEREIEQLRRIS